MKLLAPFAVLLLGALWVALEMVELTEVVRAIA